jgi:hypothetical protein
MGWRPLSQANTFRSMRRSHTEVHTQLHTQVHTCRSHGRPAGTRNPFSTGGRLVCWPRVRAGRTADRRGIAIDEGSSLEFCCGATASPIQDALAGQSSLSTLAIADLERGVPRPSFRHVPCRRRATDRRIRPRVFTTRCAPHSEPFHQTSRVEPRRKPSGDRRRRDSRTERDATSHIVRGVQVGARGGQTAARRRASADDH